MLVREIFANQARLPSAPDLDEIVHRLLGCYEDTAREVVQAAEELRRALAGRGAGGGARGLADVRLEFKLDRNFNVKEVWEAEDSGEG